MAQTPATETLARFDQSVDEATQAVIMEFAWMDIGRDDLGDLMVRLNDAIAAIMKEWI